MILIIIHYESCYNSLCIQASQNIKDVMSKCVQSVIQSFQEAPLENLNWRNIACLWIWNHKHLLYIMFPNYISSVNLSTIRAPTSKVDPLCPKAEAFMVINRKWNEAKTGYLSSIKHGTALHCYIVCLQCSGMLNMVYYSYISARCIILTDIQTCFLAFAVQRQCELLLSNENKHEITAAMFNLNMNLHL